MATKSMETNEEQAQEQRTITTKSLLDRVSGKSTLSF